MRLDLADKEGPPGPVFARNIRYTVKHLFLQDEAR